MPVVCVLISMLISLIKSKNVFELTANANIYPVSPIIDMAGCNDLVGNHT